MESIFDRLASSRIMLSDFGARPDSKHLGKTPVAVFLTALLTIIVSITLYVSYLYHDVAATIAIMSNSTWRTFSDKFLSWRTLAILLVLINSKSFPFSWHIRILYHFIRNIRREKPILPASLSATSAKSEHPLFQYASLGTRAPLFECHKSNSTYFTDLDISRTKRVTALISPAFPALSRELEKEGYQGRFNVILGSVHTSFRREIKPYERYEVRSKIMTWDRKWLVVGSSFVTKARKRKDAEEVCAASLSKYVLKKGRYTVPVERVLHQAGLVPAKPAERDEKESSPGESAVLVSRDGQKDYTPPSTETETPTNNDGITASSAALTEGLERVLSRPSDTRGTQDVEPKGIDASGWTWDAIEAERVRGMKLVEQWFRLDTDLMEEFERTE